MTLDTDVLIIGCGMSGIGFAVQLIRKFGTRSFEIIEKSDNVGGTWWLNSYPGCGCDVASHFYSFSFALNPNWSRVFSTQPEIHSYFKSVADQYDIPAHVKFHSAVQSARWDENTSTWLVIIQNLDTKQFQQRRCKVLISAVGALSIPKQCEIPGAEKFQGIIFHSAEWDHTFNWKDREIITVGNGCSATQFVPVISQGENRVKRVTQFSRQAHWLAERRNLEYSSLFRWSMRWIPGSMRLYRAKLYWDKEVTFRGFKIQSGEGIREAWTKEATDYIRNNAPKMYREALVPKTVIGCKRLVNDTDYLACLHRENVELVYDDPIKEILEDGVRTRSGRQVKADAIVLATGFETQRFLSPIDIRGEKGIGLQEHWDQFSEGTPSAYYGTCISGFPNFFVMMGPNTITGHLSVIYTIECQINFTMRIIARIMKPPHARRSLFSTVSGGRRADSVMVTASAERADNDWVQAKARNLVWSTGCTSWFVDGKTGRNTQMYPDWQFLFWARSFLVPWRDFLYRPSLGASLRETQHAKSSGKALVAKTTLIAFLVAGAAAVIMVRTPPEHKLAFLKSF